MCVECIRYISIFTFFTEHVIRGAASIAYIVFVCFLMYILTITGLLEGLGNPSIVKHLWPALSLFLPILIFLCPFDSIVAPCFGSRNHGSEQRFGLLREVLAVFATPFTQTTFLRSFIADIFCSMPKIFIDLVYSTCLYVTNSFWDSPGEWVSVSVHNCYFITTVYVCINLYCCVNLGRRQASAHV